MFSTFHAKYRLLRFPLDQLYHSDDIIINELKVLHDIDSDHLPLFCEFFISLKTEHTEIDDADSSEIEEANQMIKEGKKNENQRDSS